MGVDELSNWELKLLEISHEIVRHGHGSFTFSSTVIQGGKRKVVLAAGRDYVFFIEAPLTIPARTD